MPLYDLRCNECQKEYKKMVSYSKLHKVECPTCGSKGHERIFKANIKGPFLSTSSGSVPPSQGFT